MNFPALEYVHVFDKSEKGHRRLFVLTKGKKWVNLYCPFTCTGIKVRRINYDDMFIEQELPSRRLLNILKDNRKSFQDTTVRTDKLVKDLETTLKKDKNK